MSFFNFYVLLAVTTAVVSLCLMFHIAMEKYGQGILDLNQKLMANVAAIGIVFGFFFFTLLLAGLMDTFHLRGSVLKMTAAIFLLITIGYAISRTNLFQVALKTVPTHWFLFWVYIRSMGLGFQYGYLQLWFQDGQTDVILRPFTLYLGLSDLCLGLTAPLVAYRYKYRKPHYRKLAHRWTVLGIANFGVGMFIGFIVLSKSPMVLDAATRYPYILIPLYGVPIFIIVQLVTLWRLRQPDLNLESSDHQEDRGGEKEKQILMQQKEIRRSLQKLKEKLKMLTAELKRLD